MNRLFCSLLITANLFTMSCANSNKVSQEEMILKITFAQGFSQDNLSLFLNSCEVIKNYSVSSDETSDGVTDLQIIVLSKNGSFVVKIFQGKEIECQNSIGETIELKVALNGVLKTFNVNLKQGAYISFEKDGNQLSLNQTTTQILYD
jgi:hypothetical protein